MIYMEKSVDPFSESVWLYRSRYLSLWSRMGLIFMEKSVDPFSESVALRSRYITLWSGMGLIYMEKSVDPFSESDGFTGLDNQDYGPE